MAFLAMAMLMGAALAGPLALPLGDPEPKRGMEAERFDGTAQDDDMFDGAGGNDLSSGKLATIRSGRRQWR